MRSERRAILEAVAAIADGIPFEWIPGDARWPWAHQALEVISAVANLQRSSRGDAPPSAARTRRCGSVDLPHATADDGTNEARRAIGRRPLTASQTGALDRQPIASGGLCGTEELFARLFQELSGAQ